jgi:hypothetical protein
VGSLVSGTRSPTLKSAFVSNAAPSDTAYGLTPVIRADAESAPDERSVTPAAVAATATATGVRQVLLCFIA